MAEATPFNQEALIRKGTKWVAQHQSIKRVQNRRNPPVKYEKEELILKILQVLEEEKAFGRKAYYILSNLITEEREITKKYRSYVETLIQKLNMEEDLKKVLVRLLSDEDGHFIAIEKKNRPLKKDGVSIPEMLKLARATVVGLPLPQGIKHKLTGSLDTVKKVLLDSIPVDDCYNYDPNCQFTGNEGIVFHHSKKIHENHDLALATLRMGIRIHKLNIDHASLLKKGPLYDQVFDLNLWPMFLDVSNDDPTLAMEVLSVFGHDVISNALHEMKENVYLTYALNTYRPSDYGNDSNPSSVLYLPGALDGYLPRQAVIKKLARAYEVYNRLHGTNVSLRNGYYHVYGGVLMAQELISAGYGQIGSLDTSTLISTAMGYAYKQQQMEMFLTDDALELWKFINFNEFKIHKVVKPESWDNERFDKAVAVLKVRIAIVEFTEEQHRVGARFALRLYKKTGPF